MKDDLYIIDELISIFEVHLSQWNILRDANLKNWIENNPDKPIPDHISDDFSLPKAFLSIVKEIKTLKNEK